MKLLDWIIRPNWLKWGAIYGLVSFFVLMIAGMIFVALLGPTVGEFLSSGETTPLLDTSDVPFAASVIGVCLIFAVILSMIVSAIMWWLNSVVFDILNIFTAGTLGKMFKPNLKMVAVGYSIGAIVLLLAIFSDVVNGNMAGIAANLMKAFIGITWLMILVHMVWLIYKMLHWKLPVETK